MTQMVPGFSRLTVEADKLGGQPCIRGYRFSVEQLLGLLADGLTLEQIQADYPLVELADIAEVLRYFAASDRPAGRAMAAARYPKPRKTPSVSVA